LRKRAPSNVDPVVALVHCRRRRQVENRVGHGRIRDAWRHLVARRPKFRWDSRTIAVLLNDGRVGSRVVPAGIVCRVRQYRVRRSERDGRAMVARARVAAHANVPIAHGRRASTGCRLARCCRRSKPIIERNYVLLVQSSRTTGAYANVERTVLPEHIVGQKRIETLLQVPLLAVVPA